MVTLLEIIDLIVTYNQGMQYKKMNKEKPRSKEFKLYLNDSLLGKKNDTLSLMNLCRPNTSQARNIHTIGLVKKGSLKRFSFKKQKIILPNQFTDCHDFININTIELKSAPKTTNQTPTRSYWNEESEIMAKEKSRSDSSDESPSIYYLNEPKIHMKQKGREEIDRKNENRREIVNNEKVCPKKKVINMKPRIDSTTKEVVESHANGSKESKQEAKPMKDISDLIIFTHTKIRLKGRVRRGLCINVNKSPIPRILHSIKFAN